MKLRNIITKEICDAEMREDGIYIKANWSDEEKWFCYDLETLARGWEYYVEPKEPLIKDEKIRKAVRAWADVCKIETDDAIMVSDLAPAFTRIYTSMYEIDIKTELSWGLDEHKDYTIDELCGEEEE